MWLRWKSCPWRTFGPSWRPITSEPSDAFARVASAHARAQERFAIVNDVKARWPERSRASPLTAYAASEVRPGGPQRRAGRGDEAVWSACCHCAARDYRNADAARAIKLTAPPSTVPSRKQIQRSLVSVRRSSSRCHRRPSSARPIRNIIESGTWKLRRHPARSRCRAVLELGEPSMSDEQWVDFSALDADGFQAA